MTAKHYPTISYDPSGPRSLRSLFGAMANAAARAELDIREATRRMDDEAVGKAWEEFEWKVKDILQALKAQIFPH